MISSKESRLRELQWKILHNIYPTLILLFKMGKAESNICDGCTSRETDFIEHFFYSCSSVNQIWKEVSKEIMNRIGKHILITKEIALLGYVENNVKKLAINNLITIAKMCISKYRYGERTPIKLIFEREYKLRVENIKW